MRAELMLKVNSPKSRRRVAALLVAVALGLIGSPASADRYSACRTADVPQVACAAFIDRALIAATRALSAAHAQRGALEVERQAVEIARDAFERYHERQCAAEALAARPANREACERRLALDRANELFTPDLHSGGDVEWADLRFHGTSYTEIQALELLIPDSDLGFGWFPRSRTLADRAMLFRSPGIARSWAGFKEGTRNALFDALRARGFGPRSSRFISETFDAFRYHPETGERLLRSPSGSTWNWSWGVNEIGRELADALPACFKDLSEPACEVRYSTELGCRFDEAMADICRRKLETMRRSFAQYDANDRAQTDLYYASMACIVEERTGDPLSPSFLDHADWQPAPYAFAPDIIDVGETTGKDCRDLGFEPSQGGFRAEDVEVFGRKINLVITPAR